jgi:glycosyltransferase involved in cell wall biosynthesis
MGAVLHLIETGGPGGAESVFLELARGLNVNGLRNIAAVGRDGWLAGQARQRGLDTLIVPAQGSLNFGYLTTLTSLVRKQDVRLVIAHLFGAAIYSSLASLLTRVPVISVLHGQSDVSSSERLAGLKHWVLAHGSARVVFVSAALRDELAPRLHLPLQKCAVIENGIDMSRYRGAAAANLRTSLGLPADAVLVGAVGNLRPAKSYETLLRAAREVCEQHPRVHFVIAGDTSGGLMPKLAELQGTLGLAGRLHFLGLRSDVPAILSELDVFVLSSKTEGFSLALVEALASGRAAVATRSGGPETIIEPEKTGLLVPPEDPAALAAALERVLTDEALRLRLAAAARTAMTQRFSSERMIADYEQLGRALTGRRSS